MLQRNVLLGNVWFWHFCGCHSTQINLSRCLRLKGSNATTLLLNTRHLSGSVFMPQQVWAGPIQGGASMYQTCSRMSNRSSQIWNMILWRPNWHLELFAMFLQLLLKRKKKKLQHGRAHCPAGPSRSFVSMRGVYLVCNSVWVGDACQVAWIRWTKDPRFPSRSLYFNQWIKSGRSTKLSLLIRGSEPLK